MKELIFVRHAKSDWGNEFLKDIDRPLNERGYTDAYFMSDWFAKNKTAPDKILASTAARALNTALIFARSLDFDMTHFHLDKNIYESPVARLLAIVRAQDDSVNSLMVFGHNPSFTDICNILSDELFFDNLPTCGMVAFNFDTNNWSGIKEKKGRLNYYQFPKNFKNQS
jgi:phosphohistidine phosphatase